MEDAPSIDATVYIVVRSQPLLFGVALALQ